MEPRLIKGNEAVVKAAVLAGCRAYYGYPITPASEIAETAALYFPAVGGVFVQAESEVAAINMLYGGASAGVRAMTASSGPGISLMQEGFSYLAGAELPCVIVDMMRAGPGLGSIGPEQGDYFQIVKGGGHGCYRNLVLAPASVQELVDLTMLAFELADRYRNPVVVLADGSVGQMMEPVSFPEPRPVPAAPAWAVIGTAATRRTWSTPSTWSPMCWRRTFALSRPSTARRSEPSPDGRRGTSTTPTSSWWDTASSRGCCAPWWRRPARRGIRAGLLRPITLYPFPTRAIRALARTARTFAVIEMSTGQLSRTSAWRWRGGARWSSTAAWAATSPPSRRCSSSWRGPWPARGFRRR